MAILIFFCFFSTSHNPVLELNLKSYTKNSFLHSALTIGPNKNKNYTKSRFLHNDSDPKRITLIKLQLFTFNLVYNTWIDKTQLSYPWNVLPW